MDMWIARLTATFPHTHSPAKSQPFFDFGFNVKTNRSDSNLDWNLLEQVIPRINRQSVSIILAGSRILVACCRVDSWRDLGRSLARFAAGTDRGRGAQRLMSSHVFIQGW
jgi:hypothetical protein